MTTTGKVAIGAAVVIGGIVVYKLVKGPTAVQAAAKQQQASPATVAKGFLDFGTSVLNYFAKQPTTAPAVSGVAAGSRGSWDSTSDLYLPAISGGTTYEDSTRNDYLLS